jgi:Clp amino terminal domain, pathogenicity island component
MFERYTEKARRSIFFARYEASQFGSPYIETEYLLLGLLREDKALANRLFRSHPAAELIRKQIDGHSTPREKVSTSVDLPLSHECKRVLAYGAEESARLNHKHIGTSHLLLGLLREEASFAAQLLREQGLTVDSVREQVRQSEAPGSQDGSASFARLDQWLAELEARGGIWTVKQERVANRTTRFAIYAVDEPRENPEGREMAPAEKLAQIQKRIDSIVEEMERAIANHEFEKARFYSDEERKERGNLSALCEQLNVEEPPPRVPLLCIGMIRDEYFSDIQKLCDDYMAEGVIQVWLLDPNSKRAYTVTKIEGLREFKGGILQIASPPLEMDLSRIFD